MGADIRELRGTVVKVTQGLKTIMNMLKETNEKIDRHIELTSFSSSTDSFNMFNGEMFSCSD